jgi:hypothetical protein
VLLPTEKETMPTKIDDVERAYNALTPEQRRAVGSLADFRRQVAAKEVELAARADDLDRRMRVGAYAEGAPRASHYDARTGVFTVGAKGRQ